MWGTYKVSSLTPSQFIVQVDYSKKWRLEKCTLNIMGDDFIRWIISNGLAFGWAFSLDLWPTENTM